MLVGGCFTNPFSKKYAYCVKLDRFFPQGSVGENNKSLKP